MEKARKVQLEPGFSLQAWMRLSANADLSGGVGKADPEDEEAHWKVWPMSEIRKHNQRDDFWTVIHGKVYNLTPYLPYHPGGVEILMKTAGNDGTVLFDKYHKWVNAENLLEACFIGVVAPKREDSEEESGASRSTRRRIKWDEEALAAQEAERGVAYGTQKIDQIDTPFLYYLDGRESRDGPSMSIHSKYLPELAPDLVEKEPPGPRQVPFGDLKKILGLLETDEEGVAILEPKYVAASDADLKAKRQAHYAGEKQIAAASVGLPEGWVALLSSSEPREVYFFHEASNTTQWERPPAERLAG